MAKRYIVALCLVAVGCSGGASTIEGNLAEERESGFVWIDGETDRIPISDARFRVEGARGDTIDLQFADEDGELGRMRILGLAAGSTLTLNDVWFEDGRAFPASVALGEGGAVEINRIRMAAPRSLPEEVSTAATVLAHSRDADALIVRPVGDELPDLRVVITPATVIRGVDGEPTNLSRLEFGDSIEVTGTSVEGYVMAAEVVVPRTILLGVEVEPPADAPEQQEPRGGATDGDGDDQRGRDERPSARDGDRDDDDGPRRRGRGPERSRGGRGGS